MNICEHAPWDSLGCCLCRQGNYAAANSFLDSFATHRQAKGPSKHRFQWDPHCISSAFIDVYLKNYRQSSSNSCDGCSELDTACLNPCIKMRSSVFGFTLGAGLPALSLQWGPWAEIGASADCEQLEPGTCCSNMYEGFLSDGRTPKSSSRHG